MQELATKLTKSKNKSERELGELVEEDLIPDLLDAEKAKENHSKLMPQPNYSFVSGRMDV